MLVAKSSFHRACRSLPKPAHCNAKGLGTRRSVPGEREASDVETARAAVRAASSAYARARDPANLDRAIAAYRDLVAMLDEQEADHGIAVMDLCNLLGDRWAWMRSDEEWREAVAFVESWRAQIPPPDWRAPLYILAHGILLYRRADATETSNDATEAIETLEAARSRVRAGSGVYGTSSMYLANLRLRRFLADRDPLDLEASIQDGVAVFSSDTPRDDETREAAATFARATLARAELVPSDTDVDAAIDFARLALERTEDPEQRGDLHGLLGSALRTRFNSRGNGADLDAAIAGYEEALQVPHLPAEIEAARLDDVGNGYASRYELTKAQADLDLAIEYSRRALALFPRMPARGRACANLAISLVDRGRNLREIAVLDEAVDVAREGLELADLDPERLARLQIALADALRVRDALSNHTEEHLDDVIEAQEVALAAVLAGEADDPVRYRLATRDRATHVTRRLVSALLHRASLGITMAGPDLWRALAVGEAAKGILLGQELLRRSLTPPAGVDEASLGWEAQLLARLAALDAHELAPADTRSMARVLRRIQLRSRYRAALEQEWNQMAAQGPEAERYVAMRRDLPAVLHHVLASRPPGLVLLALLETEDVDADGNWQRGLCLLVLRPDHPDPEVAFSVAGDPLADAVERFVVEVPSNRGRGAGNETWWQELATLLWNKQPAADVTVALSMAGDGVDLPWQLILERSGWLNTAGLPIPVVVVPTLVLVAASGPHPAEGWHEVKNIAERLGIADEEGLAENVQFLTRVSAEPSAGPLVIGDPTSDLKFAFAEAATVARILGVEPLLGSDATVAAVRDGFSTAATVHVAAHAQFDANAPLDSVISLADGDLPARDLVGVWNAAELVVLSACQSGSGVPVLGGEVLGFATTLLRSGVQSVVASLWPVDDAATAYLMTRFYTAMAEGASTPRALVTAMHAVRSEPGWAPPYYWAGFMISQRGWYEAAVEHPHDD